MTKTLFTAAVLILCNIFGVNAQTISSNFYGLNAWMPDSIGNVRLNGSFNSCLSDVAEAQCQIMRYGGIAVDENNPSPRQYLKMVDSIRDRGMEPVVQVPYHKGAYKSSNAARIVEYINVTHKRNVKFWCIGNEPDLGYGFTTAAQVAPYLKEFSTAMKDVDPSIKIIGPETAWFNKGIIDGLTEAGGPHDVTGKDGKGRYIIDFISFHYYPFSGGQTRNDVLGAINATYNLDFNLNYLNGRLDKCNSVHGRSANPIRSAITEANIAYKNHAGDDLSNTGTNSFIGGQFWSEIIACALKRNVAFINFWSVIEGNSVQNNIGFLNNIDKKRKPSFYHFQLMAKHFNGNVQDVKTGISGVKVFATTNTGYSLIVMNQNLQEVTADIRFGGSPSSTSINIASELGTSLQEKIKPQSTVIFTFDAQGNKTKRIDYGIDQAINNAAPVTQEFDSPLSVNKEKFVKPLKLYPVPAKTEINIDAATADPSAEIKLQIFNMLGQEVESVKITAEEGSIKKKVEIKPSMANGVYIVRLQNGDEHQEEKIVISK